MSGLCAIKQVVLADRERVAVRAARASYSFLYKIVASVPVRTTVPFAFWWQVCCIRRLGLGVRVRGEARRREPLVRAAGVRSVRFALLLRWRLGRSEKRSFGGPLSAARDRHVACWGGRGRGRSRFICPDRLDLFRFAAL